MLQMPLPCENLIARPVAPVVCPELLVRLELGLQALRADKKMGLNAAAIPIPKNLRRPRLGKGKFSFFPNLFMYFSPDLTTVFRTNKSTLLFFERLGFSSK
jgi:hypothetical protein